MIILGLHVALNSSNHDPSASLIINGELVAAAEEERFVRVKSASGHFPRSSIEFCLNKAKIDLNQVDLIVSDGSSKPVLRDQISTHLLHYFGFSPPIELIDHHTAHTYGAIFSSKKKSGAFLTLDGYGDQSSGVIGTFDDYGRVFKEEKRYPIESSLGVFYGLVTSFLGYEVSEGEYKVMGMAAYGKPAIDLSNLLQADPRTGLIRGDFMSYVDMANRTLFNDPLYKNSFFEKKLGLKRRLKNQPFEPEHFDLAASVQYTFTEAYVNLALYALSLSKSKNLVLSGGCALNCLANKKLLDVDANHLYVYPAASDRGLSIGSAAFGHLKILGGNIPQSEIFSQNMLLGPDYSSEKICDTLNVFGIKYTKLDDQYSHCAKVMSNNPSAIIGWFQGRSEFGPRALGSRSIIANAGKASTKEKLNKAIKFRENYRPFAPAMTESLFNQYFKRKNADFKSMTFTLEANEELKNLIPAAVHFDYSTRIQVVEKDSGYDSFEKLLENVNLETGVGAVVNTSFNLNGEPIVETPSDAVRTFFSSGITHLYLENILITKN
jgi:carbamoyltransferase